LADADNWEDHWTEFGDPALGNPANEYRNRLILRLLGTPARGSTVVDIGSGQGQLALLLQAEYPDVHVLGVEYSHEGVRRATEAARAAKLGATFVQRDLLQQNTDPRLTAEVHRGSLAVCSEVLEHIDQPEVLLRNAADYLLPGCRLVVTVPGGPKSALDKHIGHRRHYRPETIRSLLGSSGYEVERVYRAGFPFFDLYRLAIIARGQHLIDDLRATSTSTPASGVQRIMTRFFARAFHWNLQHSPFGWQIVAVARMADEGGQR